MSAASSAPPVERASFILAFMAYAAALGVVVLSILLMLEDGEPERLILSFACVPFVYLGSRLRRGFVQLPYFLRAASFGKVQDGRELWQIKRVRYPCAALAMAAALYLATTLTQSSDLVRHAAVACGLILSAILAWEITLLVIAGMIAYSILGAFAALPTSVAIIIGAYIIASAQRRT